MDEFPPDDPVLEVNPSALTELTYIEGEGPSDPNSFELTGENLDETDVTITAPDNFEVSQSETTGFGSSIILSEYDGTPETIWVRLEVGLSVDTYSGDVDISGGGADPVNVALSGEVTEPPPPAPGLPYAEDFGDFVFDIDTEVLTFGADQEWAFDATGTSADKYLYKGNWGSGTAGGFRGNDNVLGYQHTGTTGVFTASLTLTNNTGAIIEDLFVSYLGKVEREGQGRSPEWTVEVDGEEVPGLFYSTVDGDDKNVSALVQGLNIGDGETFTISWSSDRGEPGGASKQIGIGDVFVDTEEPEPIEPTEWLGTSENWFDTENWTDGVPTSEVDALIPGGLDHYPTIDALADVQYLTLEDGATLLDNENLTVHGTLTMQRTIPFDGWRMISSPVSGQTIVGSDFAPEAPLPSYFDFYYFDENVNDAPLDQPAQGRRRG